jgi:ABC-type Fe3+-hydroxamate transport system substrate-binding protein
MSATEIESHPLFNDVKAHYKIHYKQDVFDDYNTPVAVLPPIIDVIIMDGGEFCGAGDFERVLTLQPSVIVLDDVKVMKNYANVKKLLADTQWKLLCRDDDRNGWAIFERVV